MASLKAWQGSKLCPTATLSKRDSHLSALSVSPLNSITVSLFVVYACILYFNLFVSFSNSGGKYVRLTMALRPNAGVDDGVSGWVVVGDEREEGCADEERGGE